MVAGTLTKTPAAAARPMLLCIGSPWSVITIFVRMPPPTPANPEESPMLAAAKCRNSPPGGRSASGRNRCGNANRTAKVRQSSSWPSRPGEFHPEPLTEPDVNLSIHPARATHRRLPPSVETDGLLRSPVGPLIPTRVTPSLRSVGITPRHRYYGGVRPWAAHRYFRPRGFSTCVFSLGIAVQVLKFRTKAQIGVTPPLHRTPHGQ